MNNITPELDNLYLPVKALVIYQKQPDTEDIYVESFDMDSNGCPINAHPLAMQESTALARVLDSAGELQKNFLMPKGILPDNVLHIDTRYDGSLLWYTKKREASLSFVEGLGIPGGKATIPAMLWKADREKLYVYALKSNKRPDIKTALFYAPFFNVYEDGNVCMGTVDVEIQASTCLEDFIGQWEHYFFGSYFSHLIGGHNPIAGNMVQLWQQQVNTQRNFPHEVLKKSNRTIKDLIR